MTRDWNKLALRRNCFKRWKQSYEEVKGEKVTEGEIHSFLAGFNMGYKSHKTKQLK